MRRPATVCIATATGDTLRRGLQRNGRIFVSFVRHLVARGADDVRDPTNPGNHIMRTAAFALPLLIATVLPAASEPIDRLTEDGRYQLMEINDRVVRLDTETGGFDLCRLEDGAWACTLAKDERLALEARIAALTRRVEALERDARAARVANVPPPVHAPALPPSYPSSAAPAVPSASPVAVATADDGPVPEREVPAATGPRAAGEPLILGEQQPPESAPRRVIRYITGLVPSLGW